MSWAEKTLDQLGHVSRGKSRHRPRDAAHLYGGPYPFIQTSDVKHANLYITDYKQTYSEEGLAQSKLWPTGTLCITIAANIADTAILKIDACFPDSIIGFIPFEDKADTRFIKYLFDAYLQRRYKTFTQGAAQDNLSQAKLLSIRFPVPDIQQQRKIADILSTYDDLITNNLRRIALLERTAELIYKEWFVNLKFPGHEQKASLSEGIPVGWDVKELKKLAYITMGQSPKSEFYNDIAQGLPFHQGVTNFGNRFVEHQTYTTVIKRVAEPGDILFSVRAPVGRINISQDKIVIGRGLSALRSTYGHQSFLYYQLKNYFYRENLHGTGAIFESITKKDLEDIKILTPTEKLMISFEKYSLPMDKQIEILHMQNSKLKQAQNLLLSKLMNGENTV